MCCRINKLEGATALVNIADYELQAFYRACEKNGVSVSNTPSHQNRRCPIVIKSGGEPHVIIPGMNVPLQRKQSAKDMEVKRLLFSLDIEKDMGDILENINRSGRRKNRNPRAFAKTSAHVIYCKKSKKVRKGQKKAKLQESLTWSKCPNVTGVAKRFV